MKLEEKIRSEIKKGTLSRPKERLQGVSKQKIAQVLQTLARGTSDQVDAVFALLDDQTPSWFGDHLSPFELPPTYLSYYRDMTI